MNGDRGVVVLDTKEAMAEFMVGKWKTFGASAIDGKGRFCAALSGGRTPEMFYRRLAALKESFPWDMTHIFLADERYVPFTHRDSNYVLLRETFLRATGIPEGNCHPVSVEEASPEKAAAKYEDELIKFFGLPAGGVPEFDLVLLGIGEDGHTASLFPGSDAVYREKELAVAVILDEVRHDRITLTLPVINGARHIVFLVSGKEKADVLRRVIGGDKSLPASFVNPKRGDLLFTADREAALDIKAETLTGKLETLNPK